MWKVSGKIHILFIKFQGRHAGNLSKHLERLHPSAHSEFLQKEAERRSATQKRKANTDPGSSTRKRSVDEGQSASLDPRVKKTLNVTLDALTFQEACVELVTRNGRPFSLMDDSGFRKIIDPITKVIGVSMDRKSVQELVALKAERLRDAIRTEVQGKLICLKMDIATRCERSFLGINIQYVDKGKLHLRTLTVTEMKENRTGDAIKDIIQQVLSQYNILKEQILSVTTDNGSNMLRARHLMNIQENGEETDEEVDNNFEEAQSLESTSESDIIMNNVICSVNTDIAAVRCSAHPAACCKGFSE